MAQALGVSVRRFLEEETDTPPRLNKAAVKQFVTPEEQKWFEDLVELSDSPPS